MSPPQRPSAGPPSPQGAGATDQTDAATKLDDRDKNTGRAPRVAARLYGPVTYEAGLDRLRVEWRAQPNQRDEIEIIARDLQRQQRDAPLIAVHEVGHALTAYLLGYTVHCISRIHENSHTRITDSAGRAPHRGDNAVIAAGGAALAWIAGTADPERGCEHDREYVYEVGQDWGHCVAVAERTLAGCERVAKRLVLALKNRPVLDAAAFLAVVDPPRTLAGQLTGDESRGGAG